MPIYEYKCQLCKHRFELMQPSSAAKITQCPQCGKEATRAISIAGFVLKGTGWYVTDYPSKERKSGMQQEKTSTVEPSIKDHKPTDSSAK